MATINDPTVPANIARVGEVSTTANQDAQHVNARPIPYGSLGHYRWGGSTGILPAALGGGSELFQFRWSSSGALAVMGKITISASVTTTMFAAGVPLELELIRVGTWTAQGTGGNGIVGASIPKARSTMANSQVANGDMRWTSTAALGAGTKVNESYGMANIIAACPITGSLNGTIIAPDTTLWEPGMANGDHPTVLAQNEGFIIKIWTVPATGTWRLNFNLRWAEVTSF